MPPTLRVLIGAAHFSDPGLWCLPVVCYLLCVARVLCSFWSARYAGIAVAQGESAGHTPQLIFQFYVDKIAAMVTTQVTRSDTADPALLRRPLWLCAT